MLRFSLSVSAALLMISTAGASPYVRNTAYDEMIAKWAKIHGVPESLVHKTVLRESRYNPGLVHHHCFGLMQLKYGTARGMGYKGDPRGLLDPKINLTYGIPYLANAYRLAGGNEERATALYRGGYYYFAKHKKMLGVLRTADSAPQAEEAPQMHMPEPPASPFSGLLSFLAPPAEAAEQSNPPQVTQTSAQSSIETPPVTR